jgi:hypothetical protein
MSIDYTFYAGYGYALTFTQDTDILEKIHEEYKDELDIDEVEDLIYEELVGSRTFKKEFPDLISSGSYDSVSGMATDAIIISPRNAVFSGDKSDTWDLQEIPQYFTASVDQQMKDFADKFGIEHDPQFLVWTTIS